MVIEVTDVSTSGDMTSQIFHFYEGTSHRDSTFTPWKSARFQGKSNLVAENVFHGLK